MWLMKPGMVALLAALALAAPAQAQRVTAKAHSDYQGMESRFQGGGGYVLYAGLHKIGSRAAVCGMIWYGQGARGTSKATEPKLSVKVQYQVDGRAILGYSNDFKRYDSESEAMASQVTGCTVTRTPWSEIRDPTSCRLVFRSSSSFAGQIDYIILVMRIRPVPGHPPRQSCSFAATLRRMPPALDSPLPTALRPVLRYRVASSGGLPCAGFLFQLWHLRLLPAVVVKVAAATTPP